MAGPREAGGGGAAPLGPASGSATALGAQNFGEAAPGATCTERPTAATTCEREQRARAHHPSRVRGGGGHREEPPPGSATADGNPAPQPSPPPPQPAVAAWSPTPTGPPPGRQTAAPAGVACAAALLPGTSSPPAGGGDLLYIVIKTNEAALCNATKGQPRKTEFRPRSCNGIRPGLPGQNQAELPVFQGLVRKELVASLWTNTCSILCGALVPITTCLCDGRGGGTPAASNGWTGNTNRIAQMLCQANRAIAQSLHRTYGKLRWGRGRGTHKCDVFGVLTVAPMARHLGVWRWCLVQALHFGSVGPLLHFTSATRSSLATTVHSATNEFNPHLPNPFFRVSHVDEDSTS